MRESNLKQSLEEEGRGQQNKTQAGAKGVINEWLTHSTYGYKKMSKHLKWFGYDWQEKSLSAIYKRTEACFQDDKKRKSAIRKVSVTFTDQVHLIFESDHGDGYHLHKDSMGHDAFYSRDRFLLPEDFRLEAIG